MTDWPKYIAETAGLLWPSRLAMRWRASASVSRSTTPPPATHPLVTPRVLRYLASTAGFDDAAWRAWQQQWFGTGLAAVEQRLATEPATGRFCHGDVPGMADICLASIIAVMRVFKIPTSGTPTVDRIVAACGEIDAFRRADPLLQVGAPT